MSYNVESVKDARKLFRLFKSIVEYQKLVDILLDDEDNLLKVFRVLGQVFFFFYWFFDNISIVYKIKLFKGNFKKYNIVASVFWLLSLLVSVPVCATQAIQAKQRKDAKAWKKFTLDAIKYAFDLFPASHDSTLDSRIFKLEIHPFLIAVFGFISATISTYQNIGEVAKK